MMNDLTQNLARRGFVPHHFETGEQAAQFVLGSIQAGQSVGFGGSMTAKQLELDKRLAEKGVSVYWHWNVAPELRDAERRKAQMADAYICSANALTLDGRLVNIDGSGNRISAILFGPNTLYVIVGRNKLVDGDLSAAIHRIKTQACGKNARRLGLKTPCAFSDRCTPEGECFSPDRMCSSLLETSFCPGGRSIHVILVDEDLGY